MGWLHIIGQGKGVYLRHFEGVNKNCKLPEKECLYQFFDKDKVDFVDVSDVYHTIVYFYLSMDSWSLKMLEARVKKTNNQAMDFRAFCKIYDDTYGEDKDYFNNSFCNVLEALFCYKYGYPKGCFKGINDYNDDNMFYCCLHYPLRVYNQKIAELTEQKYLEQLREFFYELTGDEYYKTMTLAFCEEYDKE